MTRDLPFDLIGKSIMWEPAIRTIGEILKESINQYAIPPFQRAYKWGEEEAIELVEDLKSFPEAGEEYLFLGNFILEKPKDGKIFIIDGQQRLTTIMLLLAEKRLSRLSAGQGSWWIAG